MSVFCFALCRLCSSDTDLQWDALLGHVEAVTDFPCVLFPDELIKAYPDAKVILNIRDTESWWRSASSTVFKKGFGVGLFAPVIDLLLFLFAPFGSASRPPLCLSIGHSNCSLFFVTSYFYFRFAVARPVAAPGLRHDRPVGDQGHR